MGGRATSGLQGEYGQVGSAPDWLGGLDLSASRCEHSGQSGSVCTYVPALCCSEEGNPGRIGRGETGAIAYRDRIERVIIYL